MRHSKLNKAKEEFKQQMIRSFELIQNLTQVSPPLQKDKIFLIYELSFLQIFLAWEWFIENTFILYMLGRKANSGYRPKTYIKPKDENHAYDLAKGLRDYADWTSPDIIIRKAELYFVDGAPYKNTLRTIIQDIQDIKTLRNAIVHTSTGSREKFKQLVRSKFGYAKTMISPGEFLSTHLKGKMFQYITYFRDRLEIASEKIVR